MDLVRRRRLMRTLRRETARWAALLVALALLACLVRAGSRYFYCPFMDAIVAEHCCAQDRPDSSPSTSQPDCCEVRTLGTPPAASAAAPPSELVAPALLFVLAPIPDSGAGARAPVGRFVSRSGLSPPPARRSAQQIVLRT